MFIDTHAHLTYSPLYEKIGDVIQRAIDAGVQQIVCVGTDFQSSNRAIALAEKYSCVFPTVGIHPHDSEKLSKVWQKELAELCRHPKVASIGEIGLDYYRCSAPRETQLAILAEQIEIAESYDLPVILHNRLADDDMEYCLMRCHYFNGVLHCFSSNTIFAEKMLKLGLHISFTGNVTYGSPKSEKAVKIVPLNKLMLETDSPYLTPGEKRGEINEPAFLPLIAQKIAELKNVSVEIIEQKTTETARRFFKLPI